MPDDLSDLDAVLRENRRLESLIRSLMPGPTRDPTPEDQPLEGETLVEYHKRMVPIEEECFPITVERIGELSRHTREVGEVFDEIRRKRITELEAFVRKVSQSIPATADERRAMSEQAATMLHPVVGEGAT